MHFSKLGRKKHFPMTQNPESVRGNLDKVDPVDCGPESLSK